MATVKILSLNGNHLATAVFDLYRDANTHITFRFSHQPVNFEMGASIRLYDIFNREIGYVQDNQDPGGHNVWNKTSSVVGRIDGMSQFHYWAPTEYGPHWDYQGYTDGWSGNINQIHPEGNGVFIPRGVARFDVWSQADESVFQDAVMKHARDYVERLGGSYNDLEYVVSQYKGNVPTYEMQVIAGGAAFLLGCFQVNNPKPKGFFSKLFGL